MIFVARARVSKPEILDELGLREDREARDFFLGEAAKAGYARFPWRAYRHNEVREALERLFHHKCAFCETSFGAKSPLEVEHFRPRQRCVDLKGRHFPLHYFWLANDWNNLYPVCQGCGRSKKTRFPVRGERASVETRETDPEILFESELPMLLDPCREDDEPEQKLVYTEDGRVSSDDERGRITIELFNLNRPALVEARRRKLERLLRRIERLAEMATPGGEPELDTAAIQAAVERIMESAQDRSEFAGMCRQYTRRMIDDLEAAEEAEEAATEGTEELAPAEEPAPARRTWIPESEELGQARYVSQAEQRRVAEDFEAFESTAKGYSVEEGPDEHFFVQSRLIRRIEIHNFRPIADLTIDLVPGESDEPPWAMFLGENGCGKSSVLKAVTLALMGDEYRRNPALGLEADSFVRFGCDDGYVKVHLTGMNEPITLSFRQGQPHFEGGGDPKVLLLAYGATRLLPRRPAATRGTTYARVDNLFDPFVPMEDARRWLLELSQEAFDGLKPALKQLLNLRESDDLVQNRDADRIDVLLFGEPVPLEHLSDGYQTVVALAAEIMSVLLAFWDDTATAEGIVLLDEVGSHLHPSWRMRIVGSLRATFPSVQFLISTHNPLCLRGMKEGEVVVMQRDPTGRVVVETDLPNPEAMRIDQILQSDFFGLGSTVDEEVNALYDRYYELLMVPERDSEQELELRRIQERMTSHRQFGDSERERLMLEAIDEYRAERQQAEGSEEKAALKQETKRELREMWARLRAPEEA